MSRTTKSHPSVLTALSIALIGAGYASFSHAAPSGETVVSGSVTIDRSTLNQTLINQTSAKAIINWQQFDIDTAELVKFAQGSRDAVVLNRVLGNQVSNLKGALQANGNVFLINPNGIVFGANAQIDVAGLLASTLDVDNTAFLNGSTLNFSGNALGSIKNQGEIKLNATDGFVYLVAPKVDNAGQIIGYGVANVGQVTVAAGNRFNVDLQGNKLINFNVSADALGAATSDADALGVSNSGSIKAQTVVLAGNSASGLMSSVVNNSGLIEATGLDISAASIQQASSGNINVSGSASLTATDSLTTATGSSTRAATLNLAVTADGASIGAEENALSVDADVLNAHAVNGHVLVTDVNGGVALGEVSTGDKSNAEQRRVIITAQNGSITSADSSKVNITGWSTTLRSDGAIGSDAQALNTQVDVFNASTQNGGINVDNKLGQLLVGNVTARETVTVNGQSTSLGAIGDANGKVTLSNGAAGSKNVSIRSQDSVFLTDAVSATKDLTITSTDGGVFSAADAVTLTGKTLTLNAGKNVGDASRALNIQSETLNASAADGGVYLSESNGLTIGSILAGGAGHDVAVRVAQGNVALGSIAATGKVSLSADNGAITDNNGSAMNLSGSELTISANNAIGTAANALETSADAITASTKVAQAGIYLSNDKALNALSLSTPNGDVQVGIGSGSLSHNHSTNALALTDASGLDLSFTNSAAGILVNGLALGAGNSLNLVAAGNITKGSGSILAKNVNLDASGSIGGASALLTKAEALNLLSRNGTINVDNQSASPLNLTASATGSSGAVTVKQAGDLQVKSVRATNAVALTAGGAISSAASNGAPAVTATSLSLYGSEIGSASKAFNSSVSGPVALTSTGDLYVQNTGAISLLSASATGRMVLNNSGDVVLGTLEAGDSIAFKVSGNVTDGNGDDANFVTSGLTVNAKSFGTSGDKLELHVDSLVIDTANGGIYARQTGGQPLALISATTGGSGSHVAIDADGDINLGTINAGGNNVSLSAAGAIEDARNGNSAANVSARSLDIRAPGGIGNNGDLALDVSFLSAAGGTGGVKASNAGAIAVDSTTLTGKGLSEISIIATSITVLNNNGGVITMDGGKLSMTATNGNIVFINQKDTIYLPGGGSISLTALSKSELDGYNGVIVAGNLKTDNGDISLVAQSNITIGMLDAGAGGNVKVESRKGIILDGNGTAANIRGNHVSLSASTPAMRDAELSRDTAIADYSAKVAEAAAKLLQLEILQQQLKSYEAMVTSATLQDQLAALNEYLTQVAVNTQQATVDTMSAKVDALNTALNAATVVRNAAAVIAGAAQAVPFSGDAGADAAFAVVDLVMSAASLALDSYERYTVAPAQDTLTELNNQLDVAQAAVNTAATNLVTTTTIRDTTQTSRDMADLAVFKANVARDASEQVRKQAVSAYDLNKDIDSSADKPLGIIANRLDVNQGGTLNTSLYLNSTGTLGLGDIAVASGKQIIASTLGNLNVVGNVKSDTFIGLKASGAIQGAGGTLIAPDLSLLAGNGIGTQQGVATRTERLAAAGGHDGVSISNANGGKLLTVSTQGAVTGVSGDGDISLDTDGSLVLANAISDTGLSHTVSLTAGGSIRGTQAAGLLDVSAQGLQAIAGSGIGQSGDALQVKLESLYANGGTGGIYVNNQGTQTLELTPTYASLFRGMNLVSYPALKATGGAIQVTTAGDLQVNGGVSHTGTGDVTLNAAGDIQQSAAISTNNGAITLNANGDVQQDAAINTTKGNIVIKSGGDVHQAAAIASGAGSVAINAGGDIDQDSTISTKGRGAIALVSGGSIDMGNLAKTTSDSGNISYSAKDRLSIGQIETSSARSGGTVTFIAPQILDAMPGVGNVKGWVVDVKSPSTSSGLIKDLVGDLGGAAQVNQDDRLIGGNLTEDTRRAMDNLVHTALQPRNPMSTLLVAGPLNAGDIQPATGFEEDGEGNLVFEAK